ncbi:MAG: carboxypeptidase-like regulatory domain-containing protein, partial [Weeksellaceae bacterium]
MKKLLLFLFVLISISGMSQENLTGMVTNEYYDPLPDIEIKLSGPNSYETVSDLSGAYLFENILPGNYKLLASHPDYQ